MTTVATLKSCPVCGKRYAEGEVCPDDGAYLLAGAGPSDPLLDHTLQGVYRIKERIGQGGMGVVYRARTVPAGRSVAVKALFPHPQHSADLVQRFLREAQLLSKVDHPHVVKLLDYGNTDAGVLYLVMEYLNGQTLDQVVPRDQGLPVGTVVTLMSQIGAGVDAIHANQIVHRDLKPSNVFLAHLSGDAATVKILDFGIAKAGDDARTPLTRSGQAVGSAGYMSPEQLQGSAAVDARSDVYALGGILYYLLTGRHPGRGGLTTSKVAAGPAPAPEGADLSRLSGPEAQRLAPVIQTALSPDPRRRYASAGELVKALVRASGVQPGDVVPRLTRSPYSAETRVPGGTAAGSGERVSGSRTGAAAPKPADAAGSNKLLYAVAAAVALAAGGAGALFLGGGPTRTSDAKAGGHADGKASSPAVSAQAASPAPRPKGPAVRGVTDTEILLGMSAAFSGPSRELGRGMKLGIETYLRYLNESGGVAGRKVRLIALDDGYEPGRCLANMKELVEKHRVFAVIGNVGTPTAEVAVPYALENKVLFFGAFTGANLLRKDPPDRFIFNYRASYAEETAAMVKYMVEVRKVRPEQIAVFAQQDGYGDSGFQGVARALRKYGRQPEDILRVGYVRNTVDVAAAVKTILKHRDEVQAIVMVPSYRPAARFIQQLKDANLDAVFANVSFVGSDALAEELRQLGPHYAAGVIVTQVVPHFESRSTGVLRYRELLRKYYPDEQPGFVSLEGFIAAGTLAEGLRRAGDNLTTDTLIDALESVKGFDLGIGTVTNYGPSEHQASHKVWGTVLDAAARYQMLELD